MFDAPNTQIKNIDIAIVGFGNVGRSLAKLIVYKRQVLEDKFNLRINVKAVFDSKGAVVKEEGFNNYELLKLTEIPRSKISEFENGIKGASLKEIYDKIKPDIHVELTPSNYIDGEPSTSNILTALNLGCNVVTATKSPLVLHYDEIFSLANAKGLKVKFRGTVMGGTPFIDLLMSLKSYEIIKVEGILNATTNFILSTMYEKLISYEQALAEARAIGVAEADPSIDVKGIDAAAKLIIIGKILGKRISLDKVERDDISKLTLNDIINSIKENRVIKYIATIDENEASVKLRSLEKSDPLANINGTANAVRIVTDSGDLFFVGKGGGGIETAHSVLDDIISIGVNS